MLTNPISPLAAFITPAAHPEYSYFRHDWTKVRDAIAGQRAIKSKGTAYLPMMKGSDHDDYAAYKDAAVYFNMARQTVAGMTGQVFRRAPVIRNLPPSLADAVQSIGKDGSSHVALAKSIVSEQISIGRAGVLVDAPTAVSGARPSAFAVLYTAENILDWDVGPDADGKLVLKCVLLREFERIRGNSPAPAYFSAAPQYRTIFRKLVIEDGVYRQYVEADAPPTDETPAVIPVIRGKPLDFIPFVFFGADGNTADVDSPPLLDIVDLNLSHYRTYADLEHGRKFTALPVYYAPGNDGEGAGEYHIGPNVVWEVPSGETPGILEYTGQGLKALETALAQKEQQIAAIGGRLMPGASRSISESDNQASLREANEHSLLRNVVNACASGMALVIRYWLMFLDVPLSATTDISYRITLDALTQPVGAREMRAIQLMYEAGLIPIDVLFEFLLKAEIVPEEMTLEEFKDLVSDPESFFNAPDAQAKLRGFDSRQQELDAAKPAGRGV